MSSIVQPDPDSNSLQLAERVAVERIASQYRDPTLARFAINDFRDWLAARSSTDKPWVEALWAQLDDERGARRVAGEAADRFRDVLSDALGFRDENPGDDALVAALREHFGRTGPEPTRWRDFLCGARAQLDQIEAMPDPLWRATDGDC